MFMFSECTTGMHAHTNPYTSLALASGTLYLVYPNNIRKKKIKNSSDCLECRGAIRALAHTYANIKIAFRILILELGKYFYDAALQ